MHIAEVRRENILLDNSEKNTSRDLLGNARPSDGRKLIIITARCGRMANRIQLFAHFMGFAEENGYRVMNPTFYTYANLFEGTCRDVFGRYPAEPRGSALNSVPGLAGLIRTTRILFHAGRLAQTLNEKLGVFSGSVMTLQQLPKPKMTWLQSPEVAAQIRTAKIVLINGWRFRASDCVQKHADKIRCYFQPVPEIARNVRQFMEHLRQNAEIIIGVHIRQGDYRRWREGKYFFPVSRYAEWMRELLVQFPGRKVSFLVCSDGARSNEEFAGLPVVISRNNPIEDLYSLAKCNYILGPLSTFSQWASFHGNTPLFHLHDSNDRPDPKQFRVSWLEAENSM